MACAVKNITGFTQNTCGVHLLRTMMYPEVCALFDAVAPNEGLSAYKRAIVEDNCLGKKSDSARKLTFRHLCELYTLDKDALLFRGLRFFWDVAQKNKPLLTLLCAYNRDPVLRQSYALIQTKSVGQPISNAETEDYLDSVWPDRFSASTLESAAHHCNGTWTVAGYLKGRRNKVRTKPEITPEAVSYALFIEYLRGTRGMMMFHSEMIKLLECGTDNAIQLAHEAARKGMLVLKHVDDVIEATFPMLVTDEEMEAIHEQNS